jgi:Fic family protein
MDIIIKDIKGAKYYYLEHSYRVSSESKKKSLYLGSKAPENINDLKEKMYDDVYEELYYSKFELIKKNFNKELKSMPKSAREKELDVFSINFTYNTQRIEGSTLTLRETSDLLADGISPSHKPIRDVKEAEAHKKVFFEMLSSKNMFLTTVQKWHKQLLQETNPDIAGKIRTHGVRIAGATFMPPSPVELNPELEDFYKWYNKVKKKVNSIKLSALVHLKFVSIHPFSDGNGRTSRLMMNFILKENNYPLLNIKYSNRSSYYTALENSNIKKNPHIFVRWFFKHYLKEYKSYIQ